MGTRERSWFTAFATLGLTAGTVAVVFLWLLLTRPFAVFQVLAGLP
jgi:hypothetical protein